MEQRRQAEQAKREQELKILLKQADVQMQVKRLTEPVDNNAEASYRQVLKLDVSNVEAQAGLNRIAQDYLQQARQQQLAGALQESMKLVEKGLNVAPSQPELLRLKEDVGRGIAEAKARQEQEEEQRRQAGQFLTQAQGDLREGNLEASLMQIEQGLRIAPNHRELSVLREQVKAQQAELQRQAEVRGKQEEAERQKAKQARQQAEEAEWQKAEQARRQAEMAQRRQEAERLLEQALEYQRGGQYAEGLQQIDKGLVLAPDQVELLRLQKEMRAQLATEQQRQAEQAKREKEIAGLLDRAESQFKANRLIEPVKNNAEASYRQILKLDAGNVQAQAGLGRIAQSYLQQAQQQQSVKKWQESLKLIEKGLAVVPDQSDLLHLKEEVRNQQAMEQQKLEQQRLEKKQKEQQRQDQPRQKEVKRQEQQRKEQQDQHRQEQRQQEQQKKLEQQQQRQEEKLRQEQQRKEQQRLEQQRQEEKQRQEQQRKEQQRLEQQRQEEKQRQEQQRKEQQRTQSLPEPRPQPPSESTKPRIFGTF